MTEKKEAPYETRAFYQPFIDAGRGGGIVGDSDLALQLVLGGMELKEMERNHNIQLERFFNSPIFEQYIRVNSHRERLFLLEGLCLQPGGHEIEAALKTPEDIEKALEKYKI